MYDSENISQAWVEFYQVKKHLISLNALIVVAYKFSSADNALMAYEVVLAVLKANIVSRLVL